MEPKNNTERLEALEWLLNAEKQAKERDMACHAWLRINAVMLINTWREEDTQAGKDAATPAVVAPAAKPRKPRKPKAFKRVATCRDCDVEFLAPHAKGVLPYRCHSCHTTWRRNYGINYRKQRNAEDKP